MSQIPPLQQQVQSAEASVTVVHQLVGADRSFDQSDGVDKSAEATVRKDYRDLDQVCPGVAP